MARRYLDYMYPTNIINRISFYKYLEFCDYRDNFIATLKRMRYCDWVIHSKLGRAVGLTQCYIMPARGCGKSLLGRVQTEDE